MNRKPTRSIFATKRVRRYARNDPSSVKRYKDVQGQKREMLYPEKNRE